jgi:hypothetical protein
MKNKITLSLFFTLFINAFISFAQPSDQWTRKADFNSIRRFSGAFSIGMKGYVCMGSNGFTPQSDLWEYDPATNVWTQKANFPGATRSLIACMGIGTKGYVGLGGYIFTQYNDWWEYNPATNTWTQKANFWPGYRMAASAFVIGNKGYLASGRQFNGLCCPDTYYNDLYQYDPATDTWTQKASGGPLRAAAVGFSIGTNGYVGGGSIDPYNSISDFYEYNSVTDTWIQRASIPGSTNGRSNAAGFAIDTKGYIGYGYGSSLSPLETTYLLDFWEYNPSGDTWTQRADLTGTNRNAHVGISIGTKGYMGLGTNSAAGTDYTDWWEYIPTCTITATLTASANPSCNGGTAGFATYAASGGTGALSYSWSPSGGISSTGSSLSANTYTCHISDANGCYANKVVTISQPTAVTNTVSAQTNVSCNGGNNGSITLSVSGGIPGYTYTWTPSGGNTATASNLTAGNYTCTIKDANLCPSAKTITVAQPAVLTTTVSSQANVLCNGNNTGSVTITPGGGTTSYSYNWVPSGGTSATASNLAAGNYTCTVTDANSCIKTQTVSITEPAALTSSILSQTNVSGCFGQNNGSATVLAGGGASGYTYSWAPSGGTASSASNLTADVYTCTIMDANSCIKTQTVNITQPLQIVTAISSQNNLTCNGVNNGSATVSATGGTGTLNYNWSPAGGTGNTATSLAAGNYTCTISDNNGCVKTQTVGLTQPSALTSFISMQTNVTCNGAGNGAAAVAAGGGTGSLGYSWSPGGQTTDTIISLTAGLYTCTITDSNSCVRTQSVTITQPAAINSPIASQVNVSGCAGQNNGSVGIAASGGTGVLNYLWMPGGATTSSISNITAGTYTCTITDANNCSTTQQAVITEPALITTTVVAQTDLSCNGVNNGAAAVAASGGTGALSYLWAPTGATISSVSNLSAGTYTCTVKDINNCTAAQTVIITQPQAIVSAVVSQGPVSCSGNNDGMAIITASGGTGILSYNWTPSGGTSSLADSLASGTYTCTITDANNCIKQQTVVISQVPVEVPSICLVTVDSMANNNVVYWDKNLYTSVDSFIIYRYDVLSTTYLRVGAVAYDSLSLFVDTVRTIGGPNGGDPQYSSYRYKMAIMDTCGNIGAMSPYHQSIFIQQNNQNFSWNAYVIEGGPAITGYQFLRDNTSNNNWTVLVNTSGLSTTDPNYASYTSGSWRVDALGFNCLPTRGAINTSRSNIKSPTSINIGIKSLTATGADVRIWPNPSSGDVNIKISLATVETVRIDLLDLTGRKVKTLVSPEKFNGEQVFTFSKESAGCEAGVYLVVTSIGGKNTIGKIVLTK